MAKENSKENVQDRTVRLILGIILVLIALPVLGMLGGGMMSGYGMMSGSGFGFFSIFWFLIVIAMLILGLYLIVENLKK